MLRIVTVKFASCVQLCDSLRNLVDRRRGRKLARLVSFFFGKVLSNRNFAGGVGDAVASCTSEKKTGVRECGL